MARDLVLAVLHSSWPSRGCRDSGQPEITGTRGGGGGYYRQGWAGLGMQQEVEGGRAI